MLGADDVVEQGGLVVGLADSSGDGRSLEVGIDGGVDFNKVVVCLEGLDERSEVEMRLGGNHV